MEALGALADALCDVVMEGQVGQRLAIEVRDEFGPVLEVAALLSSVFCAGSNGGRGDACCIRYWNFCSLRAFSRQAELYVRSLGRL